MTLILIDGCDDAGTCNSGTNGNVSNGRNGKGLLNWGSFSIPAAYQSDTFTIGAAVRGAWSNANLMNWTGPSSAGISMTLNTSGRIQITRPGATLASSPDALWPANTWVYLEWQGRIA